MKEKYCMEKIKLKSRVFLAPMAGINDIAFRILCKKAGAGLTYTGMIHPLSREKLNLEDKPVLQIFAPNEKGVKEFIEKYEKDVEIFDFNLGCPAFIARKLNVGAFLSDLSVIESVLKTMKETTKKPVTVKMRKSDLTFKIAKIAEKYCDVIAIHPRTQEQGYSGKADVGFAEDLKKKVCIPVIYSGDADVNNISELLKKFDFVMIGRNAIGNPGIFAEVLGKKNEKQLWFERYLNLAEKYDTKLEIIKVHASNYVRGMVGAAKMRQRVMRVKSIDELRSVINKK